MKKFTENTGSNLKLRAIFKTLIFIKILLQLWENMWENFGYILSKLLWGFTNKILRKFCAIVGKILITSEKFRLKLENHKELLSKCEDFMW